MAKKPKKNKSPGAYSAGTDCHAGLRRKARKQQRTASGKFKKGYKRK